MDYLMRKSDALRIHGLPYLKNLIKTYSCTALARAVVRQQNPLRGVGIFDGKPVEQLSERPSDAAWARRDCAVDHGIAAEATPDTV